MTKTSKLAAGLMGGALLFGAHTASAEYKLPEYRALESRVESCENVSGTYTFHNIILDESVSPQELEGEEPLTLTAYHPTTDQEALENADKMENDPVLDGKLKQHQETIRQLGISAELERAYTAVRGDEAYFRLDKQHNVDGQVQEAFATYHQNNQQIPLMTIFKENPTLSALLETYVMKRGLENLKNMLDYGAVEKSASRTKLEHLRLMRHDLSSLYIPPHAIEEEGVADHVQRGILTGEFTITGDVQCIPKQAFDDAQERFLSHLRGSNQNLTWDDYRNTGVGLAHYSITPSSDLIFFLQVTNLEKTGEVQSTR